MQIFYKKKVNSTEQQRSLSHVLIKYATDRRLPLVQAWETPKSPLRPLGKAVGLCED